MKFNQNLRDKLKSLFEEMGYKVRLEKGNFLGGECLLEQQKLLVINRFTPVEAQVTTMVEVLHTIPERVAELDDDARKFVAKLMKQVPPAGGLPVASEEDLADDDTPTDNPEAASTPTEVEKEAVL
jgi:hypothetical protein